MIPIQAHTFHAAFTQMRTLLLEAPEVRTQRWQGTDATKNPALRTHEAVNVTASIPLRGIEALSHWRRDIDPNLPWADDHFAERVGGEPLNPGEQWKNWPWASSADKFRDDKAQFNHTYMERLWPKWARTTEGGQLTRKIPKIGRAHV